MCGIIGYGTCSELNESDWLISARDRMSHRGPDHAGMYISKDTKVVFGHRRLSIISLNDDSNQPLKAVFGENEYVICYNGEIYNYQELRDSMLNFGYKFSTSSDTEVILGLYDLYGEECVKMLEGMFSFVIHDIKNNKLFFARDIVGEKPFYYFLNNKTFYFSSEFLPLISHPELGSEISQSRINQYLELGYLQPDLTFSNKVSKLPPGNSGTFDLSNSNLSFASYFELDSNKLKFDNLEICISHLNNLLNESVAKQLRSDVSIGVLLSGGIDSSIISCKANEINDRIVNYTVDFGDNIYELKNAELISNHYGVKHEVFNIVDLTPELIDSIISRIDEPIADSSFIPTYLITEMIKSYGGTVVLGGDGADELFGGYSVYNNWSNVNRFSGFIPGCIKELIQDQLDNPYRFNTLKSKKWLVSALSKVENSAPNVRYVFSKNEMSELVSGFLTTDYSKYYNSQFIKGGSLLQNLSLYDLNNYLSSNILLKNDRASMLNSIELRAPFLSKKIIDFAFSELPDEFKIHNGESKFILRKLGGKVFPKGYIFHSKRGFNFNNWFLNDDRFKRYFHEVITQQSCIFLNDFYVNYLLRSDGKRSENSFVKLYALLVLSKWVSENKLKIIT
jgi:asparagine synthase (glutamine-hydrolysing)